MRQNAIAVATNEGRDKRPPRGDMLSALKVPPIVEVVCGFHFDELSQLDPLLVGQFWATKRQAYPKREVRPPVREVVGLTVSEGIGPMRSWLVSAGDEFVIQIQPDRFYFNWRKHGDVYPRFGDHDGGKGVLSRALTEFEDFAQFCRVELGSTPATSRVELAKIDVVRYSSVTALGELLPLVDALRQWTKSDAPEINVHLAERVDNTDVLVLVSNAFVTPDLSGAVRLETRAARMLEEESPSQVFTALNVTVNGIFEKLFSAAAMKMFRGESV